MSEAALQGEPDALPDDLVAAMQMFLALPYEAQERFLAAVSAPWQCRSRRLKLRADLLLQMAIGLPGDTRTIATAVHRDLSLYATTRWPRDKARELPAEARHRLHHRLLNLSDGKVLSVRSLERIFAEVSGRRQKQPR